MGWFQRTTFSGGTHRRCPIAASHPLRNRPLAERAQCVLVEGGKLSGGHSGAIFSVGPESKVPIQTTSWVPAAPPENHSSRFTVVSYNLRLLPRPSPLDRFNIG